MAGVDPEFVDKRVAALDDKLTGLLAEIGAVCATWAVDLAGRAESPKPQER